MTLLITVLGLLLLVGFIFLALSIAGKVPVWIAVLFLFIIELLRILPLK